MFGSGVYCCAAMSVFIPCFLKLFEVMGAFLWEIKSITARSKRQGKVTAGPFRLIAEKTTAAGDGYNPYCYFSIHVSAHFTSGITAKY